MNKLLLIKIYFGWYQWQLGFNGWNSSCNISGSSCIHISGLLRGLTLPLPIDVTWVKLVLSGAYGTFLWGEVVREYPKWYAESPCLVTSRPFISSSGRTLRIPIFSNDLKRIIPVIKCHPIRAPRPITFPNRWLSASAEKVLSTPSILSKGFAMSPSKPKKNLHF